MTLLPYPRAGDPPRSGLKENVAAAQGQPGRVAGFWVRVLSDAIDALVLGAFGHLIALPLRGLFEHLGERGVLVGLAISLGYAGILQSRIGRGQTVGKRLLGLRVVKLDGSFLSVDRSFVRYGLVAFPVYQTAIVYAIVMALPFLRLEWLVGVGYGLSTALFLSCFLVIPFHPLKRGLHDILTGTVVTRRGPLDPAFVAPRNDPRRDRRILAAAFGVAVLATVGGVVCSPTTMFAFDSPATTRAARELGMTNFIIGDMKVTRFGKGGRRRMLFVSGFLPRTGGVPDWDRVTNRLAAALHEDVPASSDVTFVSVKLRTGFNIGIASSYENANRRVDWKTGALVSPFH